MADVTAEHVAEAIQYRSLDRESFLISSYFKVPNQPTPLKKYAQSENTLYNDRVRKSPANEFERNFKDL